MQYTQHASRIHHLMEFIMSSSLSSELNAAELYPLAERIIANQDIMNSIVSRLTDAYAASYVNNISGEAAAAYDRAVDQIEQIAAEMDQPAVERDRFVEGPVREEARRHAVDQVMLEVTARADNGARVRLGLPAYHEERAGVAQEQTVEAVLQNNPIEAGPPALEANEAPALDPIAKSLIANEDFSNRVVNQMSKAFLIGDVNAAMTQARRQIKEMAEPAVDAAGPEGERRVNEVVQQVMSEYQGRADAIVADVNRQARPDRQELRDVLRNNLTDAPPPQELDPAAPDKLEIVRRAREAIGNGQGANDALDAVPPQGRNPGDPDKLEAVRRAREAIGGGQGANEALDAVPPQVRNPGDPDKLEAVRMAREAVDNGQGVRIVGIAGGLTIPSGAVGQISAPDTPNGNAAQGRNR
jgi:hypothetical protein